MLEIVAYFSLLSLMSVGGANVIVPEMYQSLVLERQWMSDQEFMRLFALAQALPGPNVLVVSLFGLQRAGLAGGMLATVAMIAPAASLSYGLGLVWGRFEQAPWRIWVQAGLLPVSIGLVGSAGLLLFQAALPTPLQQPLACLFLILGLLSLACTRLNPLWVLATGAILGGMGWI